MIKENNYQTSPNSWI